MARKPQLPSYIDDAALKALSETFDQALEGVRDEVLAHFPEDVEDKFYETIPPNEESIKEDITRAAIALASANRQDKYIAEKALLNEIRAYLIARGVPQEMPEELNDHMQSVADHMITEVQRRKTEHQTARKSGYLKK